MRNQSSARGITTWSEFPCSANQHTKNTIKKKSPYTFAHLANFPQNVSAMSGKQIVQSCYCDYRINKMSVCSRCLICILDSGSLYLHVPRTQRILGFFIVITHKSTGSENPIIWQIWRWLSRLLQLGLHNWNSRRISESLGIKKCTSKESICLFTLQEHGL